MNQTANQIKLKYSGEKQICFCDAANDKNCLFSKADLRRGKREQIVDDGPWVRAWLNACPQLSVVRDNPPAAEVKPEVNAEPAPVAAKWQEPVKSFKQSAPYKRGPKGK